MYYYQWPDKNLIALRLSMRHGNRSVQQSESQVSVERMHALQFLIFRVWDVVDRQLNIRRVPRLGCDGDVF